MTRHPSDLQLEEVLAGLPPPGVRAHLDGCADCAARLSRMEAEGAEFRAEVYPATVEHVKKAAASGFRLPRWTPWVLAPTLAAAALLVVARPAPGPGDAYVGTKGAPLALTVYAGGDQGARSVDDGAKVAASAALRFRVRTTAACPLYVLSVDASGAVSKLLTAQLAPGEGPALPGGARLDGQEGPERVYAVCGNVSWEQVASAAKAAAGGGAGAVRAGAALALPSGVSQATLLLEKTAHP